MTLKTQIPILIREETLKALIDYKEATGKSISYIVEDSILLFLAEQGIGVIFPKGENK